MATDHAALPPDNNCRIAIYDVLVAAGGTLSAAALRDRVVGRLRVLAPQEIHHQGAEAFLAAKLDACRKAGLVVDGPGGVVLTEFEPSITYPDGTVRTYTPGLIAANERLARDNQRLRDAGFDPTKVIPSVADEPDSEQYQRLKDSMREHGWISGQRLVRFGEVTVDGRARETVATELGIKISEARGEFTNPHVTHQAKHRQSVLDQVTLMLDLNANRLTVENVAKAQESAASLAARPWWEIDADLTLTRDWRGSTTDKARTSAVGTIRTKMVPFQDGDEPTIPISEDGQWVAIRNLVVAAGLDAYDTYPLAGRGFSGPNPEHGYMNIADVRQNPTGFKQVFVRPIACADAIVAMRQDRRGRWKPGWDQVEEWLRAHAR